MLASNRAVLRFALALCVLLAASQAAVTLAWDSISCGSKKAYIPDLNCTTERCCQCNYQWDLELCGSDEWCKKGAHTTLEACNRKAVAAQTASNLHILDGGGGETYQINFATPRKGRGHLWILNGNGSGPGDLYAVRSAEVRLNGKTIVSPSQLHEGIDELRVPVELEEGPNQIAVTANGNAGATLTISVY
jgi:hypothetical protein